MINEVENRIVYNFWIFFFIIFISSCTDSSDPALFIPLYPEDSGIAFQNRLTESDSLNIIQYLYFYNGGGVATGDLNNDGLTDVFFASNMAKSELYLNRTVDGTIKFEKSTQSSGLSDVTGWSTGVNLADVNGDGLLDIYLCQVNYKSITGTNRLFINQGIENGVPVFLEESENYGLAYSGLSTQSAFFDFDLDGDLDMYLLNHSVHSPENYTKADVRAIPYPGGDRLYRQDDGIFVDVTDEAGIYSSRIGFGLGIAISDLNRDGYPDIYIGNDFHENDYLYLNQGDGTFLESIKTAIGHTSQFSMGVDIADINNDGWNDILSLDMMPRNEVVRRSSVPSDSYEIYNFKHNFGYHHQLPRNALQLYSGKDKEGMPRYAEIAQLLGVEDTDWSWSGLLADYNNDGRKDLFVSNGIVRRPNDLDYLNYISNPLTQANATDIELATQMPDGKVANFLFINEGNLSFENASATIAGNEPGISNGAAYADFDNDGDLDLITNNINAPAALLINQTNNTEYLRCQLEGNHLNKQGLGAKLFLYGGDQTIFYEQHTVRGMMSASADPILIGTAILPRIDSLVVEWPGGRRGVVTQLEKGQTILLKEDGARGLIKKEELENPYFIALDSLLLFTHKENEFIDASSQKLIPWLLSTQGPALAVGDMNGDGLEDVYIGGARNQPGALFLQSANAGLIRTNEALMEKEKYFEDVAATFFDADGDRDLDLYVVSGGNEALNDSPLLWDRIYINDGQGSFTRMTKGIPLITENGSSVAAADIDADGDSDLALGSVTLTNNYGNSKGGNILINDSSGKFGDATKQLASELTNLGMITDLEWSDIDSDGDMDLVVAGEWMPITLWINEGGKFEKRTIPSSEGLWRCLSIADLDNDGAADIIAGNFGTNTYLAQGDKLGLAWGDFDDNLVSEPLIYYENDEEVHPIASRDLLINQMNYFKNLHDDYTSFANQNFAEIFQPVIHKKLKDLPVQELATCWFRNLGNAQFQKIRLPKEAQLAPVFSIAVIEQSENVFPDLFLGGNFYEVSPYIGRADASYGTYLKHDGKGNYKVVPPEISGLFIEGQIRNMNMISIDGTDHLIVAKNNAATQVYRRN